MSSTSRVVLKHTVDRKYIPALVALENRCFRSYYWTHRFDAEQFRYYFDNLRTINLIAIARTVAVGYILGIVGSGRRRHVARIYSLAVDRAFLDTGNDEGA